MSCENHNLRELSPNMLKHYRSMHMRRVVFGRSQADLDRVKEIDEVIGDTPASRARARIAEEDRIRTNRLAIFTPLPFKRQKYE